LLALGIGLGGLVDLGSDQRYVEFITPGLLTIYPMWAAVGECTWGSYFRMESQRTYNAIITTPVGVEDVIAGEVLWGATRAVISGIYILIVAAAFGAISSPLAIAIVPLSLLPGIMLAATGLAYTSIARSVSSLNYFFAIYITPMFWLGGTFFPVDRLPDGLEIAAWFIPATHVVDVYRGLVEGDPKWSHLGDLLWIVVVSALFFYLALVGMRRRLIK
jgi:lipooligosaccharide transport system permease protein